MIMLKALTDTLTNMNVVSAVTSTIFIILLGFFLRRKGIFSDSLGKTLSKVVLTVALPALAFNSFMQPIDPVTLRQGINVLIWGIIIYILLIFITPFMYFKSDKDKKTVLSVLTTFGSTTFFGIPIVGAVWGAKGVMYSSIFNIGYRIFLYSYAYMKLSGLKLEKKNIKTMLLNPIVIATFLGLFLWLFQDAAPHVTVPAADATGKMVSVAFYRIDQTAIWLFKPLSYLAALASPLAWLAIGVTLGSVSFSEAATDKTSWYYSWNKVVIVPLINLVLLFILTATHILPVDNIALSTIIVMMATPTAAVAAAYSIGFDHGALMTSNASFISTVCAVVAIPLWIVVLSVIKAAGMFG
ncbi:AEC family transporter [Schleiferilactobacillus perolens]|uniref:AEC family transporter n=1 Tax=Schleiferilactobacillus perolens TaxID=100468 RepID=UPI002354D371|nr:AEC family transporter [Schleiferilactobacillus perolens]MCI2170520.1 AEC family transporter [Schleiferilactobacillus perolens]